MVNVTTREPDDYVVSTGRTVSVKRFIEISARFLGWGEENKPSIIWEGEGLNEIGRRADTNEIVIKIDPKYFRPTEVEKLCGDATKAYKKLNWEPRISLEDLIKEMIIEDKKQAQKDLLNLKIK